MEQWEYMTNFVHAHIDNPGAKEYLKQTFPNWKNPPKFAPQTMLPVLNDWGAAGWELIHMEPIQSVGKNDDVGFFGGSTVWQWSNVYFCVFKRRINDE